MRRAGVVQNSLGRRRLPGVDVRDDANVANGFDVVRHDRLPAKDTVTRSVSEGEHSQTL